MTSTGTGTGTGTGIGTSVVRSVMLIVVIAVFVEYALCNINCYNPTNTGCSPPHWDVRWDMASSGYTYCWDECILDWLANNTHLGVYAGITGVDHYWVHQGMPCVNGIPQQMNMMDAYTREQQRRFPRIRMLQYRIPTAVPYDDVVHELMVTHPDALVHWPNGTLCRMPYVEHGTTGYNCAWEVRAAAYDWSQPRVQQWWLDNVIKRALNASSGAWIDNDGPDNGAWLCSGNQYPNNLPAPWPALNETQIVAFCDGEVAVVAAAQQWLIQNGGFEMNCIDFVKQPTVLPQSGDSPDVCAKKLIALDHRPAKGGVVLYGDRNGGALYNDTTVAASVAVFLLTRAEYWWFGFLRQRQYNLTTTVLLLSDFGSPLGNMTRDDNKYIFERNYSKMSIELDCATFTAKYTPVANDVASA